VDIIGETFTEALEIVMNVIEPQIFAGPHHPHATGYGTFTMVVGKMQDATHGQLKGWKRLAPLFFKTGEVLEIDPNCRE
jgi:hypothetical protein